MDVPPDDEGRRLRALLAEVVLFRDLPSSALDDLLPHFTLRTAGADEAIVRQGEAGDELYIVEAGTLEVRTTLGGRAIHLGVLGPGDFFGEMAVLRRVPRTATVTATTPARLWSLSRAGLVATLRAAPLVGDRLRAIMRERELANALRALQ